jgi:hypothetical protein
MRASTRLKRLERLRPRSFIGFKQVFVTVPRSGFGNSGEPCPEHANCRVAIMGPLEAHFQPAESPPGGKVPD